MASSSQHGSVPTPSQQADPDTSRPLLLSPEPAIGSLCDPDGPTFGGIVWATPGIY
jgi:hypothetical protein